VLEQEIIKSYQDGQSLRQIAENLSVSVKKVFTTLKRVGVTLRNKSEAKALLDERRKNGKKTEGE